MKPPIPKKIKKKLLAHGDERIDDYYWLRDDSRKNKKVINYLKEENSYSRKWFKTNGVTAKKYFRLIKKDFQSLMRATLQKSMATNTSLQSEFLQNIENITEFIKIKKN